jgi:hypothetical protein
MCDLEKLNCLQDSFLAGYGSPARKGEDWLKLLYPRGQDIAAGPIRGWSDDDIGYILDLVPQGGQIIDAR